MFSRSLRPPSPPLAFIASRVAARSQMRDKRSAGSEAAACFRNRVVESHASHQCERCDIADVAMCDCAWPATGRPA